MIASVRV